MKYPYAIFDLDGTLLDSMPAWQDLGSRYLRSKKISPPENLRQILGSLTMEEAAVYFQQAFGVSGTVPEIVEEAYGLMRREYEEEIPSKPGIRMFLERMRESGIKMCVATASNAALAASALKRLGLYEYFAFILDCEESGSGKNSPAIYDQAAYRMGGSRENTLVFEDALHAIVTAREAGYYVVGVSDPAQKGQEEEIRKNSHFYLTDYETAEAVWEP